MIDNIISLDFYWLIVIVFILLTLSSEIGFRLGKKIRYKTEKNNPDENQSTIVNAALGLLALFLGFTFSSALDHFENNRNAVTEESGAITVLYSYAKHVNEEEKEIIIKNLINYAKTRIYNKDYKNQADLNSISFEERDKLINSISSYIYKHKDNPLNSNIAESAETIIKTSINRDENINNMVPKGLFVPIFIFLLFNGFIMGLSLSESENRRNVYSFGLYFLIALSVGIIMDLDKPNTGFINVEQNPIAKIIKIMELE